MNDSSHSSRSPAGRTSTFLLLVIVLLPVLYVLSFGLFTTLSLWGWLGPRTGPVYRSVMPVYSPLKWLVVHRFRSWRRHWNGTRACGGHERNGPLTAMRGTRAMRALGHSA